MDLPRGDLEHLKEGMVAICGVSYDLSCTSRDRLPRFGPRAIRDSSGYYAGAFSRSDLVEITTGDRMSGARRSQILGHRRLQRLPTRLAPHRKRAPTALSTRSLAPALPPWSSAAITSFLTPYASATLTPSASARAAALAMSNFPADLISGPETRSGGMSGGARPPGASWTPGPLPRKTWSGLALNGYLRREEWDFAQERELSVFTLADVQSPRPARSSRKCHGNCRRWLPFRLRQHRL